MPIATGPASMQELVDELKQRLATVRQGGSESARAKHEARGKLLPRDRVDRLLELCRTLQEENRSLRHSQEQLATERAQLLARNEQARSRVEAMILRLKSLEQNHG